MSSGLSMTSVNKIKELAEAHEYDLAIEILDSQDLEKSLNPQFLRTCGEVYENVGRLKEARQLYVKSHTMAPESTRIMFSLINYYLKAGYFKLAERYFEEYVYYCNSNDRDLANIKYIMKKAKKPDLIELYEMLHPYYRDNMDVQWSFELLLLYSLLDKEDIDIILNDYKATFKSSPYLSIIDQATKEKMVAWDSFFIYSEVEVEDNNPDEEDIRIMEAEQLEKDYYRMNPPEDEAVITTMVAGDASESIKLKKPENVEKGLKNFIKRKFKKKPADESEKDSEETTDAEEKSLDDSTSHSEEEDKNLEASAESEAGSADALEDSKLEAETVTDESVEDTESVVEQADEVPGSNEADTTLEAAEQSAEETLKQEIDDIESYKPDYVTYEFDDGFAPESDTITGLGDLDSDYEDEYDSTSAFRDFAKFQETIKVTTPEYVPEPEPREEFDEAEVEAALNEIEQEIQAESDVPDSVVEETIDETIEESVEETIEEPIEELVEESAEEPIEELVEEPIEESAEDSIEEVIDLEVEEEIPELEEESLELEEDTPKLEDKTSEFEKEPEASMETPVVEELVEESVVDEIIDENDDVLEATTEESIDASVDEAMDDPEDELNEVEIELEVEEDIPELEVEEDIPELEEEVNAPVDETVVETTFEESEPLSEYTPSYMKDDLPSMDFSKFSSDLFPSLGKEEKKIENKFEKVIQTESVKLDEGLKEEEAKLKEAEALLASLGITL